MGFQMLSFLLILACAYYTMAQGSYDDCCLTYRSEVKPKLKKMVCEYRDQVAEGGCHISATVFTLKRGKQFCGDPKQQWVQELRKKVDKQSKRKNFCEKNRHHQGAKRG